MICAVVLMSSRRAAPARRCCADVDAAHQVGGVLACWPSSAPRCCWPRPGCSANTLAPRASGVMKASAWIDTNRSACTRRALRTRSCSGTKKSASRVSIARMPGRALRRSRSCSATASTTSFSRRPRRADGAGVFAAVAGVERDDDQAVDPAALGVGGGGGSGAGVGGRGGADAGGDRRRGGAGRRWRRLARRAPMSSPSASCTAARGLALGGSLSRISASSGSALLRRVEVEHQPVLVGRHRRAA